MLKLTNVSLRRGARQLLANVNLTVYPGQKLGVTGANGIGKSSLFALITGALEADSGEVVLSDRLVIAQVLQDMPVSAQPAIEYVIDGDDALRDIERAMAAAEAENNNAKLMVLQAELEKADGYSARARAGKLLHGLGFAADEHEQAVNTFSGGWRMRLNLARALMKRSDMLLLDEPTNHLDLDAMVWLERWLARYQGMLLLITHDREFLDRVATHIAHLAHQTVSCYTGNYSAAEARRADQLVLQQKSHEKQQREIAHMKKFVERFRYKASKARQAQSRLKALERMQTVAAVHADHQFAFAFENPESVPNPMLTLDKVTVGYGDNTVLRDIAFSLQAGARVGLLGANGAGKSTMMKLLAGELRAQAGEYISDKRLHIGYFAQHQVDQLGMDETPLAHLVKISGGAKESALRGFLGQFGYSGDMVNEPVGIRSGGEKARLVLAMLVYQKPNLLLLDEPTNHLDMEMRQTITEALQEFEGGLVIVAHDRYLLRLVTDELWLVDDGHVTPFSGDLDDYVRWLNERQRDKSASQPVSALKTNESAKNARKRKADARARTQPVRNRINSLERDLAKIEQSQQRIQTALSDPDIYNSENKAQLRTLLAEQSENTAQQRIIEEDWIVLSAELEELMEQ